MCSIGLNRGHHGVGRIVGGNGGSANVPLKLDSIFTGENGEVSDGEE